MYKGKVCRVISVDPGSQSLMLLRDEDAREVNVGFDSKNLRQLTHNVIYWEKQSRAFCGVHCVNNILQGGYFREVDFNRIAIDLDRQERSLLEAGDAGLPPPGRSNYVDRAGG